MVRTTETRLSDEERGKETTEVTHPQFTYRLVKRLLFPSGVFVFCLLYLNNTYGRIPLENLVYPYVIMSVLLVCLGVVYVIDIKKTLNEQRDINQSSIGEDIDEPYQVLLGTIKKQKKLIIVSEAAIVYLLLIVPLGYFPASALVMIGTMRATGVKNWIHICSITVSLLIAIYIVFIQMFGLQVPQGILAGII